MFNPGSTLCGKKAAAAVVLALATVGVAPDAQGDTAVFVGEPPSPDYSLVVVPLSMLPDDETSTNGYQVTFTATMKDSPLRDTSVYPEPFDQVESITLCMNNPRGNDDPSLSGCKDLSDPRYHLRHKFTNASNPADRTFAVEGGNKHADAGSSAVGPTYVSGQSGDQVMTFVFGFTISEATFAANDWTFNAVSVVDTDPTSPTGRVSVSKSLTDLTSGGQPSEVQWFGRSIADRAAVDYGVVAKDVPTAPRDDSVGFFMVNGQTDVVLGYEPFARFDQGNVLLDFLPYESATAPSGASLSVEPTYAGFSAGSATNVSMASSQSSAPIFLFQGIEQDGMVEGGDAGYGTRTVLEYNGGALYEGSQYTSRVDVVLMQG